MPQDNETFTAFYSQVATDVADEILFRAQCSLASTRTPEQLEWMNSRTSWASVTLLQSDGKTVRTAINNKSLRVENNPTITGQFGGIKQEINNIKNIYNDAKNIATNLVNTNPITSYNATDSDYLAANIMNTRSGRTGPALQTVKFSFADTTGGISGLVNDCQIEILIPDTEMYITDFDKLWFRPGAIGVVEIGHSVRLEQRPNFGRFVGNMYNYTIEYDTSGMVRVVLYFKAISELLTNIAAYSAGTTNLNNNNNVTSYENTFIKQLDSLLIKYMPGSPLSSDSNIYGNTGITVILPPDFERTDLGLVGSLYTTTEIERLLEVVGEPIRSRLRLRKKRKAQSQPEETTNNDLYKTFIARVPYNKNIKNGAAETDGAGTDAGVRDYISLSAIIKILNCNINMAWNYESDQDKLARKTAAGLGGRIKLPPLGVTVSPLYSTSIYYSELVSADPSIVILPGTDAYPTDTYYSDEQISAELNTAISADQITINENSGIGVGESDVNSLPNFNGISQFGRLDTINNSKNEKTELTSADVSFYQTVSDTTNLVKGYPAHILFSVDELRLIFEAAFNETKNSKNDITSNNKLLITHLLNRIAARIRESTGGAINLQLTVLPTTNIPTVSSTDPIMLVLRDANSVSLTNETAPEVLRIPMFTNSLQAIDSKFNINIGGNSEFYKNLQSQAPVTSYQRIGTVVRSFNIRGRIPQSLITQTMLLSSAADQPDKLTPFISYINSDDKSSRDSIKADYKSKHIAAIDRLKTAKRDYANIPDYETAKQSLYTALTNYIAYPVPTMEELKDFQLPLIPLEVEIELDGIHGFRYGDVVSLNGLPPRYNEYVFNILQITHTVSNQDWITNLRCLMRPVLDI